MTVHPPTEPSNNPGSADTSAQAGNEAIRVEARTDGHSALEQRRFAVSLGGRSSTGFTAFAHQLQELRSHQGSAAV